MIAGFGESIDLARISTKIGETESIRKVDEDTLLISGGLNSSLFAYTRESVFQYDEDLDVALRSRGHPGMKLKHSKYSSTRMVKTSSKENADENGNEAKSHLPRTGDEAVEFFGRAGEDSETKVLFLNRAHTGLNFRPYDLVVVDRSDIEPEYFTMSSSGVVHIKPNQPSQFTHLGQWWRRSSLFNTLRSIPFFKNFVLAKTHQLWNQNVRFRKYSQIRKRLVKKLFLAKKAFCSTLIEVNHQCFELRSTLLLQYSTKHSYNINEYIDIQNKVRTESSRAFENIVDKVQALLEKVCDDVTSRVRASEDGLPAGGIDEAAAIISQKSQKSKSMQQLKQEKLERERALLLARQEVAMLAQFIRLADYMVVESLLLLVIQQADIFFQDLEVCCICFEFLNAHLVSSNHRRRTVCSTSLSAWRETKYVLSLKRKTSAHNSPACWIRWFLASTMFRACFTLLLSRAISTTSRES